MFHIKRTIKQALPESMYWWQVDQKAVLKWRLSGKSLPLPGPIKRKIIASYGKSLGLGVLIETGTHLGQTVYALRNNFDRIISIELDEALYRAAQQRFSGSRHIAVLLGNSAVLMPSVLNSLDEPALFWLDAHYSGGVTAGKGTASPIETEVGAILRHPVKDHAVLIDDARHFGRDDSYPSIVAIQELVKLHRPDSYIYVEDDIIRIQPRGVVAHA